MRRRIHRRTSKGAAGFLKRIVFTMGALVLFVRDHIAKDVVLILREMHLFAGIGLILFGLLSIASDRYCDGNASTYYACTRPSTYYYFPWWAILAVILGSYLTVLWFLRRK